MTKDTDTSDPMDTGATLLWGASLAEEKAKERLAPTPCSASDAPRTLMVDAKITPQEYTSAYGLMKRHAMKLEREHDDAIRELSKWAMAFGYTIGCLKSHHMTRAGIPALVAKAESITQQNVKCAPTGADVGMLK